MSARPNPRFAQNLIQEFRRQLHELRGISKLADRLISGIGDSPDAGRDLAEVVDSTTRSLRTMGIFTLPKHPFLGENGSVQADRVDPFPTLPSDTSVPWSVDAAFGVNVDLREKLSKAGSLAASRAKAPPKCSSCGNGTSAGSSKKSKTSKSPADPRQHKISRFLESKQKQGELKGNPCFAFNGKKGCTKSNCKFNHVCGVPACGKSHSIWSASQADCPSGHNEGLLP